MLIWFPVAFADSVAPGVPATCAPLVIEAVLPGDGAEAPPDVMPTVVHNNGCGSVPVVALSVADTSAPVPAAVEEPAATVVRLVPDEPLVVGETYALDVDGAVTTFTVADVADVVPGEAAVDAVFGGAAAASRPCRWT